MIDLIVQVLATLALVLGIAGGESLATRAFGAFKKQWYYLVEIALFVISIVVILNNFAIKDLDSTFIILFYFLTGLITIIAIRAVMTGFGIAAEQISEKVLRIRKEEDYILGLKKALKRRGFSEEKIKRIATETGFDKKKIDEIFDYLYE